MKFMQLVIFRLGESEFGLEITSVLEASRMLEITRVPQAPGFIEGVVNLHGEIIPVIDLFRQFGISREHAPSKTSRIIVVEAEGQTAGLVVDEIPEVVRLSESDISPAPEIIQKKLKRDYLKGVAKINSRLVIVLDINRVLSQEELESVGKLNNASREAA